MYINCAAHAYCYEGEMQEMEMCHFNAPAQLAKSRQVGCACGDGRVCFPLCWEMRSHVSKQSRYDVYESHLLGSPPVPTALFNVRGASLKKSHAWEISKRCVFFPPLLKGVEFKTNKALGNPHQTSLP